MKPSWLFAVRIKCTNRVYIYGSERTCFCFASFYVTINVSLPVMSYFERVHEKHSVGTLWPRRNHSNNEKAPKARWVEGAGEANTQQCDTLLERSCTKKQCWCFLVLCGTDESTANLTKKNSVVAFWPGRNHSNNEKAPKHREHWGEGSHWGGEHTTLWHCAETNVLEKAVLVHFGAS